MARIVCFGEILLRMTAPGQDLLLQRPHLDVWVGGAEGNVAVALACLGHSTAMVSAVPDNDLGEAALRFLRGNRVDVANVARTTGRMGFYFLAPGAGLRASSIIYDRQGSSFARATAADFDWPAILEGADLLHLSGITPALGPDSAVAAEAAAHAAADLGVPVSFDGNYRAQLWQQWDGDPAAILAAIVLHADVLFGNRNDIGLMLGRSFAGEGVTARREAAEAAFDAFPRLKRIASTARHIEGDGRHRLAARLDMRDGAAQSDEVVLTTIVDRIGTGDAFAAGILHGLLTDEEPDAAVRTGLGLACLKHSLPGDACLLGPADLRAFLDGQYDVRR
jgi:2-dehydro-3-deoxygluconokinase